MRLNCTRPMASRTTTVPTAYQRFLTPHPNGALRPPASLMCFCIIAAFGSSLAPSYASSLWSFTNSTNSDSLSAMERSLPDWAEELRGLDPLTDCHFEALPKDRQIMFSIEDFGGVGDGVFLNTAAFRGAVDAFAALPGEGGGKLLIPKGVWLTGPFNLTSHMTLELTQGAVIAASQTFAEYNLIAQPPSYGLGREYNNGARHQSIIMIYNCTDVVITGMNATIDGMGRVWWEAHAGSQLSHMRPHMLEICHSNHVLINNITFLNSPFWNIRPLYSSCVILRSLTIVAPSQVRETDGIDPDSSSNVLIEDCYISTGDDAIAIKSGWDMHGYNLGIPSRNIVIRRVTAAGDKSAGISIGSEMSGGVENIFITDCTVANTHFAFRIKSSPGRGGFVRKVLVSNMRVDNIGVPFLIDLKFGHGNAPGHDPNALPIVSDIAVQNVSGNAARVARLYGLEKSPALNLHLSYFNVTPLEPVIPKRLWSCTFCNGTVTDSLVVPGAKECPHQGAMG